MAIGNFACIFVYTIKLAHPTTILYSIYNLNSMPNPVVLLYFTYVLKIK